MCNVPASFQRVDKNEIGFSNEESKEGGREREGGKNKKLADMA